ncbi:putative quinol monooxygenase [Merismopedia glauca]|uniref:Antibiotic biosynthesis monooxygenase n=1 Tax=Merismopedia glauca CCAP 1448/3 TaxID=1296344 RepID=A0A2T1CAV3_9CYAN|nr:putative quinol monooxygenase [Merismopedia glauca]PSB05277.1 antibiotic biosynthesis monooxygenase [Merismopedia glauca CCAP 1448/3]
MTQTTVRILARMSAFPDRLEEAKALLIGLVEPTRQESGCIRYELLQNLSDPTEFTFIEEWESEAALNAHLSSAHISQAFAQVPLLIASGPDIMRHTLLI